MLVSDLTYLKPTVTVLLRTITSSNKYNSSDSKRYYDNSTRNNSSSGSISIPRSNTPTKKQYPIKVKSDGPKRGKNDNS